MVQYDEVPHKVADSWPPYRLAYTTLGVTLNITKANMIKVSHLTNIQLKLWYLYIIS